MRLVSWAFALVSALLTPSLAAAAVPATSPECGVTPYVGFDSRLDPKLEGRLPAATGLVVGMEVVNGRALVALSDRVVAIGGGRGLEVSTPSPLTGLAVNAKGEIWLQSGTTLSRLTESGPRAAGTAIGADSRLVNGGADLFLRLQQGTQSATLTVGQLEGPSFGLAAFDAPLRAASWGPEGLTAVVGDRAITWAPGAAEMKVPMTSPVLAQARDVCRSGDQLVIALPRVVLHVTPGGARPLVAGFPARCRFAGGDLLLLDEKSGLLWRIAGLERLAAPGADAQHAKNLLGNGPSRLTGAARVAEAVRLVGCDGASVARPAAAGSRPPPTPVAAGSARAPTGTTVAQRAGILFQPAWLSGGSGAGLTVRVNPGSAAERAGLQSGDRLISVGGRAADTLEGAEAALAAAASGATVSIVVLRANERLTKSLVLP